MNLKHLITIDSGFKPLYLLLKWSKGIFSFKNKTGTNFIVTKFFGLGSITRVVFVLDQLSISKEKVVFITFKRNKEILEILGIKGIYIDSKHIFSLFGTLIQSIFYVWGLKDRTILDMERSSYLSGIFRLIIAINKPCSSFSFNEQNDKSGNQQFISLRNKPTTHAIAEMFNKKKSPKVCHKKEDYQSNKHEVIININAGEYLPERMFPLSQYAQLATKLHQQLPTIKFILTGSEKELNRVKIFEKQLITAGIPSTHIKNKSGKQTLRELIGSLKSCKVFITNDSGPLHIAHYFGVKTVCIWGPTSAYLVGYPNSEKVLNIIPNEKCSPCFLNPKSKVAEICNHELTCFKSMQLDTICNRVIDFINFKTSSKVIDHHSSLQK